MRSSLGPTVAQQNRTMERLATRAQRRSVKVKRSPLEIGIRNIIYNVEQNPKTHTVEEMLRDMRRCLGVGPDDRV